MLTHGHSIFRETKLVLSKFRIDISDFALRLLPCTKRESCELTKKEEPIGLSTLPPFQEDCLARPHRDAYIIVGHTPSQKAQIRLPNKCSQIQILLTTRARAWRVLILKLSEGTCD